MGSRLPGSVITHKRPFDFYLKRRVIVMSEVRAMKEKIKEVASVLNRIASIEDVRDRLFKGNKIIDSIGFIMVSDVPVGSACTWAFVTATGYLIRMVCHGCFIGVSEDLAEMYAEIIAQRYQYMTQKEKLLFENMLKEVIEEGRKA